MERLRTLDSLHKIWEMPFAVLFKHSVRCLRSFDAYSELEQFYLDHPKTPVFFVLVQSERDLSDAITRRTHIPHASPQVFLLCSGQVASTASHDDITVSWLEGQVRHFAPAEFQP